MRLRQCLSAVTLAVAAASATLPVSAAPSADLTTAAGGEHKGSLLLNVDARSYRHCHNMPRRIRCHGTERLPVNWPPNSDTPGTSSLRERHADTSSPVSLGANHQAWETTK
jgi:hypothetical protein